MSRITITEALAEVKTIGKRIQQKRNVIASHIAYPEQLRDPFERDGGTFAVLKAEQQSIHDLLERIVQLRRAIILANSTNHITVGTHTRTIGDWLCWRREVAPQIESMLNDLTNGVNSVRDQAKKAGMVVGASTADNSGVIINIDEMQLFRDKEALQTTMGQLDGQISLKNATITIDV